MCVWVFFCFYTYLIVTIQNLTFGVISSRFGVGARPFARLVCKKRAVGSELHLIIVTFQQVVVIDPNEANQGAGGGQLESNQDPFLVHFSEISSPHEIFQKFTITEWNYDICLLRISQCYRSELQNCELCPLAIRCT